MWGGVEVGVSQVKEQDFESSVKVGDCVFVKIDVLGQNVAWGRFSRFLASYLFINYCFHVCSLEDIIKFNLSMKFELSMTISLSVVLIRTSVIPE